MAARMLLAPRRREVCEVEVMKGLEGEDGVDVGLRHGPYQGALLDDGFVVCQRCTREYLHE